MDPQQIINILVCPGCRGALQWIIDPPAPAVLRCSVEGLQFSVEQGIPVLLTQAMSAAGQ